MKKIMFNDKYGLMQAVLDGRKTMTRRLMPENIAKMVEAASKPTLLINSLPDDFDAEKFAEEFSKYQGVVTYKEGSEVQQCDPEQIKKSIIEHAQYKVGEEIAIAQSYKSVCKEIRNLKVRMEYKLRISCLHHNTNLHSIAGWNNKMFVKPKLMPHQIKITDVRFERLRDISGEDCLNEGVYKDDENGQIIGYPIGVPFFYTFTGAVSKETGKQLHWTTAKEAFSELIDSISGKGTWEINPWTFVYEFKLIS